MARAKLPGKTIETVWKRNSSLGRPIGTSAKPINKKKRKKKNPKSNGAVTNEIQETSVKSDDHSQISGPSSVVNSTVVTPPDERISSIPKISNGANVTISQANGTCDNNSSLVRNKNVLFHSLCYSEDVLSALPNRTWAIHSSETPEKRIVVSAMNMYKTEGAGLAPVYVKQIVFDEKLNFEILLLNSRIVLKDKPTSISTMHDFEDLLDYVDGLKVCLGGPPISRYNRVNPECAYRDSLNHWRHNLCSLEINNGEVCECCKSLEEILRRHAQRNRTTVKSGGKRKR